MAIAADDADRSAVAAKITDEDIERHRRQIGVSQHVIGEFFNREVSLDGIRHYAFGMIGDDNPLWHDPDYGASTRWRGQIAPPFFASTIGINETPRPTPEMKALFKGLYRGVGHYNVGSRWQMFRPLRAGETIFHDQSVDHVEVKEKSAFAGGRTVFERLRHLYFDKDGSPVAVRYESYINAERGGSAKAGKYSHIERHVYSEEEIARIDTLYRNEERRGADPRLWDDVSVGDEIVPVVKGPLSVVEIIGAHVGWGLGVPPYGGGPLRYDWKTRDRMPAFYNRDRHGIPSSMMRLHWDADRARELGLPAPYDYGQMRSNWLAHAATNWMGDEAWIHEFETKIDSFNFHGDTTIVSGVVTGKRMDGHHPLVELTLSGTNQRGEVSCKGVARIALPSHKQPAVLLPKAPQDLCERAAALMLR